MRLSRPAGTETIVNNLISSGIKESPSPYGDTSREAVHALRGYIYQIYHSALAWLELESEEFLFLEVAEDYANLAQDALNAVQVKETAQNVTINSHSIIASIDSYVDLRKKNPDLKVRLHHLTTSKIGKEKSAEHRVGNFPTLEAWRKLARIGDVSPLRNVLQSIKLSKRTKNFIRELNNEEFRKELLQKIHFDCGALETKFLERQLLSRISNLLITRGGVSSQVEDCLAKISLVLLNTATKPDNRYVDRLMLDNIIEHFTNISVNRLEFEEQSKLINEVLAASMPEASTLTATRISMPRPINEVPLPSAVASRTDLVHDVVSSLSKSGVSWLFGAAGVGKTVGAKIAARQLGGNWGRINLRGLDSNQVQQELVTVADAIAEQVFDGLLIDDLDCSFDPDVVENLLYLRAMGERAGLHLLITSPRAPGSDFLFSANLPTEIAHKFGDFSEADISEILTKLNVHDQHWAKYIHLISGGGHPQLAVAAIQSMQSNGWNVEEIHSLQSLLYGNKEIDAVRQRSRERLLDELPESTRSLLERLSLKTGSFQRNFVLDMAQIEPPIADPGIVFDKLIGTWVDQQESDRFSLSQLLLNYATSTLREDQKTNINFEIANSLLKDKCLDPYEANSALIAAKVGKNTMAIIKLCMSVIGADHDDLEMIAPHLLIFSLLRTDVPAYEEDAFVSQMLRGAQLLLLCHEEQRKKKFREVLESFALESQRVEYDVVRASACFLIYSKLLLSTPKFGNIPNFWKIVTELDNLLENRGKNFPDEMVNKISEQEANGVPIVGLMFTNQARQLQKIEELLAVFEFLDKCDKALRLKLLVPYSRPEFDVDMLVSGAWLREHDANTINPTTHSEIFSRLESIANRWGHIDLAVCCTKFQAIIIDEYGGEKDHAISILDQGLKKYGRTNSELVRAKAKVLYRADDHKRSLQLSRQLIDGNAPLSNTERAFLGRDAAISAEKQGDYKTARRYYLYGSSSSAECDISDMFPMRVGLMADAALASWHDGDKTTCLQDFVCVLNELNKLDPASSLRAAHCHVTCRHVLGWLDQQVKGEMGLFANDEEMKIYPGVASNPEPHPKIGENNILPIEMVWYVLATLENNCGLDLGITRKLDQFMPSGPVFEGQIVLTESIMDKALRHLDVSLFFSALRESVAQFAYMKEKNGNRISFNPKNVTFASPPSPTREQQADHSEVTEMFFLFFASMCIFTENAQKLDVLNEHMAECDGFVVRTGFQAAMIGTGITNDFNSSLAFLLAKYSSAEDEKGALSPSQVFEVVFKVFLVAKQLTRIRMIAKPALNWLRKNWSFMWSNQRFFLKNPTKHEEGIAKAFEASGSPDTIATVDLMLAILPTMGIPNEDELEGKLRKLRAEYDKLERISGNK